MPCFGDKRAPQRGTAEGILAVESLTSHNKEQKSWLSRVLPKPVSRVLGSAAHAGHVLLGHHGPPPMVYEQA